MRNTTTLLLAATLALAAPLAAPAPALAEDDAPATNFVRYPVAPSVTHHTVEIEGHTIPYTATCGTITLVDDDDKPTADVFFIAYTRTRLPHDRWLAECESYRAEQGQDADCPSNDLDPATRPVTFSFNGGPGSSSVWLHLGLFGPQRVAYADDIGNPGPPPFGVIPNAQSMLDRSDFVFIDPVSTGYSRAAGQTEPSKFHGLEEDISSVGDFIRRYLTQEDRWASPKFLAGESYGTTRAAGLANYLGQRHGIALNGIVLVSIALDFQTLRFAPGLDLPYILILPSYAATAHYHHKLDAELQNQSMADVVAEASEFALGPYASALALGDTLPEADAAQIAAEMSRLTGLDEAFIRRADLRVNLARFTKELLRDQGLTVGRLDSRFTGVDRDDAGETFEFDPSYPAILANYTNAFNTYVHGQLAYESDLPYEILTGDVHPWRYGQDSGNRPVNVAERLRSAMHQQPHMRVLIASGYTDLATPTLAAEYTLSHMQLDESLRANVETRYYPAGHMMYVHGPSLIQLKRDLDAWYDSVPTNANP